MVTLDCVVCSPKFTKKLAATARRSARRDAAEVAAVALDAHRRSNTQTRFWKGRVMADLREALPQWEAADLAAVGRAWQRSAKAVRIKKPLNALLTLPGIGQYLGHSIVRLVAASLELKLRGDADSSDVPAYVKTLHKVCKFRDARGALVRHGVRNARSWAWCALTWFYCEAA